MFVCAECGSENVEQQVWMNINTWKPSDRCLLRVGTDGNFCRDCNKHVTFDLITEEKPKINDTNKEK